MILPPTSHERLRLIGILDQPRADDAALWARVRDALAAGLPALMLRDRTTPDAAVRPMAEQLRAWTREAGALLIMNRRIELAVEVEADGVHVGQEVADLVVLKERLGPGRLLGYSAHAEDEAMERLRQGADYVLFSPIFATPSKAGILEPVGLERLQRLCEKARTEAPGRPVIALGGIDRDNLGMVMKAGAGGAAMIRGLWSPAADPAETMGGLLRIVRAGLQ